MKTNTEKTLSQKIRTLVERGHSNKYIVDKLKCNPRTVYNIRYRVNKELGIAALGKPAPKRVPKAEPTGTGITSTVEVVEAVEQTTAPKEPGLVIDFAGPEPIDWHKLAPFIATAMALVVLLVLVLRSAK